MTETILTILIPSYNRGLRVRALISYLIPFVEKKGGCIEIVVSNNLSTDGTEDLLSGLNSDFLTVHNRREHIVSAEAHIFRCVDLCKGTYVWFLGDDDIPQLATIQYTLGLLESNTHDFLMFNSISIDVNGGHAGCWIAPSDTETTQVDFTEGATFLGYTFSLAGISNAIMRRAPLLSADWRPIADIQLIYSHVAWWLVAFKGYRLTAVNKILVYYKLDDAATIGRKFTNYAIKINVPDYQFWTVGLIEQMIYLERVDAIETRHVYNMFELRGDGTYYRFLDNIVHLIWAQSTLSVTEEGDRNRISGPTLERMTDWLLRIDPGYFDCVEIIKDIHAMRSNPDIDESPRPYRQSVYVKDFGEAEPETKLNRLNEIFHLLEHRKRATNPIIGFAGSFLGFDKFLHLGGWVAFDAVAQIDRQRILRKFSIVPFDNEIIVAANEAALEIQIRAVRGKQSASSDNSVNQSVQNDLKLVFTAIEHLNSRVALLSTIQHPPVSLKPELKNHFLRLIHLKIRRAMRNKRRVPQFFDEDFYLKMYPDVKQSDFQPHMHFLKHGLEEGRRPNPMFDPVWYLRNNADAPGEYGTAFEHFLSEGIASGRRPHPFHSVEQFKHRYGSGIDASTSKYIGKQRIRPPAP